MPGSKKPAHGENKMETPSQSSNTSEILNMLLRRKFEYEEVLNRLSPRELLTLINVSRENRALILPKDHPKAPTIPLKDDITGVVNWNKFGAKNYDDFIKRIDDLPKVLRAVVLDAKFSIGDAEKIKNDIFTLNKEARMNLLSDLLDQNISELFRDNHAYLEVMLANNGVAALLAGLITPHQAAKLPSIIYLQTLLGGQCFEALTQNIITAKQVAEIRSENLFFLDIPTGISLLKDGFITVEQIDLLSPSALMYICGEFGETAIRERLLLPAEAAEMPTHYHLKHLFSSISGVEALRQDLVTLSDVAKMKHPNRLDVLLSVHGQDALIKNLITVKEADEMSSNKELRKTIQKRLEDHTKRQHEEPSTSPKLR